MLNKHYKKLRLILGDQLNARHTWYQEKTNDTLYVIAELHQESEYVCHHIQKITAFFAAMENFANALINSGFHLLYLNLDDTKDFDNLTELLNHLIDKYQIQAFEYQRPDEFRLAKQLNRYCHNIKINSQIFETEHFLLDFNAIDQHFIRNKPLKMEVFYRKMRKQHNILMDNAKPKGGKWNYDAANRNKLKLADLKHIPEPKCFVNPVEDILNRIERHQIKHFGNIENPLYWPVNRKQALELLAHFCQFCLPHFGQFQDAMTENSPHQWSLYHSRLSFALNSKMLHPRQVIDKAIETYQQNEQIDIAQIEGFVRQILGWREFVRGIYWANMPQYADLNQLDAKRDLPAYFWNGQTQMNCMKQCLTQSLNTAYAHHIQRLMVIGNFCLISGIEPKQVDDWYLGVYIDAIEWVEMPNTRGMSQFADGGLIATKPYAASANYIDKMSDYCQSCHYDKSQKSGEKACPFNSLYWHFLDINRKRFEQNPRMAMMYRQFDKKDEAEKHSILAQANHYLLNLDKL